MSGVRPSWRWLSAALLPLVLCAGPVEARRHALLIGVGNYTIEQWKLEGPGNDVDALERVLTAKWGFAAKDVEVLKEHKAVRGDVLAALRRLVSRSAAGDEVMIYFSGHGTSRRDPFRADRADSLGLSFGSGALLAYDAAYPDGTNDGMVVACRDLRPALHQLDTGGRKVFLVIDACYSGNAFRGVGDALKVGKGQGKSPPGQPDTRRDAALSSASGPYCTEAAQSTFPYRNLVFLGASSDAEKADEITAEDLAQGKAKTHDGKPASRLTDALIRVLDARQAADADGKGLSYGELYEAVRDRVVALGHIRNPHTPVMRPSLDDGVAGRGIRDAPVFGAGQPATGGKLPVLPAVETAPAARPTRYRIWSDDAQMMKLASAVATLEPVERERAEFILYRSLDVVARNGDYVTALQGNDEQSLREFADARGALGLLQSAASLGRRDLAFAIAPESSGDTFVEGDRVHFSLRGTRGGVPLVIGLDSQGRVTRQWPDPAHASARLKVGALVTTGDSEVGVPWGTDHVFAFEFDAPPEHYAALLDLRKDALNGDRGRLLLRALETSKGRFGYAYRSVRTQPDCRAHGSVSHLLCKDKP